MQSKLAAWINPDHIGAAKQLSAQFKSGTPFSHLVLKNFFLPQRAAAIRTALLKEAWHPKSSDLFSFHQTDDLASSRNNSLQQYYQFFGSRPFLKYISSLTGSRLTSIDAAGQQYADSDFLLPHDDRLEGRKIAYILNLSRNFSAKDGGQLDFFAVDRETGYPTRVVKSVVPSFNTLTIFKVSKTSFHQVREVLSRKTRLSIGGWFHG